jgi:glycosyltransferase involved in cell wall biosynthesis
VWYKGRGELRVKRVSINREVEYDKEEGGDILAGLANKYSKANCFLIPIVTLGNGLELKFPEVVILHDLVTLEFYDYFVSENPKWKDWIEYGKRCAEKYGEKGVFFCGISKYVIKNQLLKFIKTVKEEKTDFIYHAPMIPEDVSKKIIEKGVLFKKYGIKGRYIFYPTQIRPYKNLITLLKAIKILDNNGINIQLVLTANFEHDKKSQKYLEENNLLKNIVFCGDVTESELYSLYRYADVTVTTSLFEGGFPLQALEAIMIGSPVIAAKIPVTIERLVHEGFNEMNCGIKLFNAEDEHELADSIKYVIENRDPIVTEQNVLRNKFAGYTWDVVSKKYYSILSKICMAENYES